MTAATGQVKDTTCEHCVDAVSSEIAKLDGVTNVAIDLDTER